MTQTAPDEALLPRLSPFAILFAAALLGAAFPLFAQDSPPPQEPPPAPSTPAPEASPSAAATPEQASPVPDQPLPGTTTDEKPVAPAAALPPSRPSERRERNDAFGNLNIYLPEGEFDIRIRKLIKNVLFEGQVNYKFVDGDISTFLRYKYYARSFTYKIGVFDTIEFPAIESGSRDFDRVRGGLLLFEYPFSYTSRVYSLFQMDGLSFGDVDNPDNNKNNVYTKLAWQFGTTFDERLNAIVGESRGRITPVLTAYRDIGPQKLGLALALTQGFGASVGDYTYTKLEGEALKRFDLFGDTFVFSRLHTGTMLAKDYISGREDEPLVSQYSIPYYEYFRIGGRDALKGVDDKIRGTDEIHLSNELFVPVFRGKDYRMGLVHLNALYGIGYLGTGAVGFDRNVFTDFGEYVADAGLGFEAGLTVRDYDVFMNLVYAQTIRAPEDVEGSEIRFSIRTSRF